MKTTISRIDATLPLPEYHTPGAVAFDFYAREDVFIAGKSVVKIPSNLIIATPPGFALIVASRSSLFGKKGLILTNGIGIIDNDFCGPNDEIQISVYNVNDTGTKVDRGERIAQGVFVAINRAEWLESQNKTVENSRGGFGSTD